MVGVAQLVEHRIVAPVVVGSIPIAHPIHNGPLAQLVEQLTLNQLVEGSSPSRPTNKFNCFHVNTDVVFAVLKGSSGIVCGSRRIGPLQWLAV